MQYKLIAIDADKTLLSDSLAISPENKKAIAYAYSKGVHVLLCSGRSYKSLRVFAEEIGLNQHGSYIISFNGVAVFDAKTHEQIYASKLDIETALFMVSQVKKYKNDFFSLAVYDTFDSAYAGQFSEYTEEYEKMTLVKLKRAEPIESVIKGDIYKILLVGENSALKAVEKKLQEVGCEKTTIFFTTDYLLEIINRKASKGSALEYAARKLGVPLAQTIAIGDHYNDISMVSAAGLGVAMCNAIPELKEAAGYVTLNDNNNSGVAEAIYKFI